MGRVADVLICRHEWAGRREELLGQVSDFRVVKIRRVERWDHTIRQRVQVSGAECALRIEVADGLVKVQMTAPANHEVQWMVRFGAARKQTKLPRAHTPSS